MVARRQLALIAESDEFAQFEQATSELRVTRVEELSDAGKIAFWLNVYALLTMHGYVVNASRLRDTLDIIGMLRLHRRFCYEIGGFAFSAIQVEHSVLRGTLPRPTFIGTRLVIPKFSKDDPRCELAPKTAPSLLTFGLNPGIAHHSTVDLRAFGAKRLYADLHDCAANYLCHSVSLNLEPRTVTLPIQLLWHQADFGQTETAMLQAILPLLPAELTLTLQQWLTNRPHAFTVRYHSACWEVKYRVRSMEGSKPSSERQGIPDGQHACLHACIDTATVLM